MFKKVYSKISGWLNRNRLVVERNPENFEESIQKFLETLFIQGETKKQKLLKSLNLCEEVFVDLKDFLIKKGYIRSILGKELYYYLTELGTEFLFQIRKTRAEEKRAKWMMIATMVLAISALLTFIIQFTPSIVVYGDSMCPQIIFESMNYTTDAPVDYMNLGGTAHHFELELLSEDFRDLTKKEEKISFLVNQGSRGSYPLSVQVMDYEKEKVSFKVRIHQSFLYVVPWINSISDSCDYIKKNENYELEK